VTFACSSVSNAGILQVDIYEQHCYVCLIVSRSNADIKVSLTETLAVAMQWPQLSKRARDIIQASVPGYTPGDLDNVTSNPMLLLQIPSYIVADPHVENQQHLYRCRHARGTIML